MADKQPGKMDTGTGVANTNDPNATNPQLGLPTKEAAAAANSNAHTYTNTAAKDKPQH